ncbi:MAG TPA: QueT transporter family protein [Nitrososphaerales archaeon]|nr:QueT transporter family protein [Nitrososphaerales archaeon]
MNDKRIWTTRNVALAALLAALYAAYVLYFGFISFGPLQFRLVDALLPLSVLFGPPAIAGVTVGCFIGNALGPNLGVVDIVGGPTANLLAATLAWIITRKKFRGGWVLAISLEIAVVAVIVGTYVVILAGAPGVPFWVGWVEFLGSEIVPIGIVGYPLLKAVDRTTSRNPVFRTRNPS